MLGLGLGPTGAASSARQAAVSAAQYVELSAEYVDWLRVRVRVTLLLTLTLALAPTLTVTLTWLGARLTRRRLLSDAYVEPPAAWVELGLGLGQG